MTIVAPGSILSKLNEIDTNTEGNAGAGGGGIGSDVDVISVPAPLNVVGEGVAANALRVHLSNESIAALENISVTVPGTVDLGTVSLTSLETITVVDGGDSLTVDGTVAATQSGTWNIGSITTLPTLPEGTNSIGSVNLNEKTVSGTITAQNTSLTGTASANSTVAIDMSGLSNLSVQVTANTFTGALSLYLSNDNATWVLSAATDAFVNTSGVASTSIAALTTGFFSCNTQGAKYARLSAPNSTVTGSANIILTAKNSKSPSNYLNNINVLNTLNSLSAFAPFGTTSNTTPATTFTSSSVTYLELFRGLWKALTQSSSYYLSTAGAKTEVKSGAGVLDWFRVYNSTGSIVYLQVFDSLAVNVTLGSTAPTNQFTLLPGVVSSETVKIGFSTGLTYAITTTAGGSTAASLNLNLTYK
jgi:hypothetical protein